MGSCSIEIPISNQQNLEVSLVGSLTLTRKLKRRIPGENPTKPSSKIWPQQISPLGLFFVSAWSEAKDSQPSLPPKNVDCLSGVLSNMTPLPVWPRYSSYVTSTKSHLWDIYLHPSFSIFVTSDWAIPYNPPLLRCPSMGTMRSIQPNDHHSTLA